MRIGWKLLERVQKKPDLSLLNRKVHRNLYQVKMSMDNKKVALIAAKACDLKKAIDIRLININKVSFITEWIVIAEGLSDVQVRSISKSVENDIKDIFNIEPLRKEGINEAKWALLDYGDLIVNIFQPEFRKYYDLESFWSNGDNFKYP